VKHGGGFAVWIWALIALALSLLRVPEHIPFPYPQVLVAGLALVFFFALIFSSGLRRWTRRLDLHGLTLFHLWRIVPGVAFLMLHNRRMLAGAFAVPAGWGDIAVGVTAPIVAALLLERRTVLLLWHLAAMADLVIAITIAAGFGMVLPNWVDALRHFPFSWALLFFVPLSLQAHIAALYLTLRRYGAFREEHEPPV